MDEVRTRSIDVRDVPPTRSFRETVQARAARDPGFREALFQEADKDKNGSLDEKEVAAGIDLLAPPPGLGPPAAKPAEPRKDDKEEKKP